MNTDWTIYLRAWWPEWLASSAAMGLTLNALWGLDGGLLLALTITSGVLVFFATALINMAFIRD